MNRITPEDMLRATRDMGVGLSARGILVSFSFWVFRSLHVLNRNEFLYKKEAVSLTLTDEVMFHSIYFLTECEEIFS